MCDPSAIHAALVGIGYNYHKKLISSIENEDIDLGMGLLHKVADLRDADTNKLKLAQQLERWIPSLFGMGTIKSDETHPF
mgnify:CR=1 FL=1